MTVLRFDFRDIFRSARLAFSLQRLWIQSLGLLIGYLGYFIFTYVAIIASGISFDVVWSRYGLLPHIGEYNFMWYSDILFGIGLFIFLVSWLITSTAVARAVYMNLKGFSFYSWKDAFKFAFGKKGSLIAVPISIFAIALFTGLGGYIVGLFGKIPYAGELGVSLFSVIWFAVSIFLVFILLAGGVSFLLTPAILATTDDDAFEGIFQSFSTMYSQPWRLIIYEVILIFVSLLGFLCLAFFSKQAWKLMTVILALGMGDKYIDLSFSASYFLQNLVSPAIIWSKALLGDYASYFFFARNFVPIELHSTMAVSSRVVALFLVFIGGYILSYPLAIFNTGNSLIFLILKKKKDDENLLERKDREEEDEEIIESDVTDKGADADTEEARKDND